MHPQARAFVASIVTGRCWPVVVEVGGRDINGGVRDLITAGSYTACDLYPGPGVDIVTDCRTWTPDLPADLVVCCEVLEHTPDPHGVIVACASYLRPGGTLVVTCAGPGRGAHSGIDGGPIRPGEHYAVITPVDLLSWLVAAGMTAAAVNYAPETADVYATGLRAGEA